MRDKTIVGNAINKSVSLFSKEWLTRLEDHDITPEIPIHVNIAKLGKFDRHKGKVGGEIDTYDSDDDNADDAKGDAATHAYYSFPKHTFTVDGYNDKTNTILEANGCYWHGCRKCYPESVAQYNKTMERKNILEGAGYRVEEVLECEWTNIKKSMKMKDRKDLEQQARDQSIILRDALFGGRTDGFKS